MCASSNSLDFCVTFVLETSHRKGSEYQVERHCAANGTQSRRPTKVSKSSSCRCWEMMERDGLKFNKICNSTILTKMNQVENQAIQIHESFTFGIITTSHQNWCRQKLQKISDLHLAVQAVQSRHYERKREFCISDACRTAGRNSLISA